MLLNEHPQVVLGIERFSEVNRLADPFLLAPERLVAPLSVETRVRGELLYSRLGERVRERVPEVVGDVDIGHMRALDRLELRLGHNRALVIIGEPAPGEVDRWRETLELARRTEQTRFSRRLFVLLWEPFLTGDERWLRALLGFLEIEPTDRLDAEYRRLCANITAGASGTTSGEGELLAWLHARAAVELDRHAPAGRPLPARVPEPVLTAEELAARGREREQLLAERAGGSEWPDQREQLTVRYREQVRDANTRGRRIMTGILTAGSQFPSPALKVNLISPELHPQRLGRAYAFEQLAVALARLCTVRVYATQPWLAPPPGVELRLGSIAAGSLQDDEEVVVYPADIPDAQRLLGVPRRVMFLDGFEAPGDETVLTNLGAAREAIATSQWLCALAREHGVRAVHLPLGLDRAMFAEGPGTEQRALHVTGVAQTPEWMGCEALSDALVRVREARPEVSVTLFGGVPADGATSFISHPPLGRLVNVLRSSAVHVAAAREEGFGYTGAAALACGAALVSTDTRGCAEYAIDRSTALVVPVDDSGALADRILELLADPELRARLTAHGGGQVRRLLPPWSEVARRLAVVLLERD